jgi:hypothetical protein
VYPNPAAFLRALAGRLKTTPDRVPAARAIEELLGWLEHCKADSGDPPLVFVRTAARLVYEQARLLIGPSDAQVHELAVHLATINEKRPQARAWSRLHWRKLARLVLKNRRLPLIALFSDDPPSPAELIRNVELPFAARYVEDPPDLNAHRLSAPPLFALLDRAQELLESTASDLADANDLVQALRSALNDSTTIPRQPPRRSNSANLSQELGKSRSNSAK